MLLALGIGAFAMPIVAEPRDCIIVHLQGGGYIVFPLEQQPRIVFDGQVVTIGTEHYQVSNIRKYTIGDSESTGIVGAGEKDGIGSYTFDGEQLVVRLSDAGKPVRLCNMAGIQIPFRHQPTSEGLLYVQFPPRHGEVYLLTIGSETFKIMRP